MDWLKELLESVEGASALYDKISGGIGKQFVSRSDFNSKNEELKTNKSLVSELQGKVESIGADEKKYADLKAKYDTDTETLRNENKQIKTNFAIDGELSKSGAKNMKALKALLDMGKVTVGDDGKVDGLKDQLDSLRKSDSYLFEVTKQRFGTDPSKNDPDSDPAEINLGEQIAKEQNAHKSQGITTLNSLFGIKE
jgi:hypothetical protein